MKKIVIFSIVFLFFACSEKENSKPKKEESLIEIKDGIYTEYYPGRKAIKFRGPQDSENRRHGKWVFLSPRGTELSVTCYNHGLKDGHTIVKYPNGILFYYGEYRDDIKVGIWKTYDQKGKLMEEKDFGGF